MMIDTGRVEKSGEPGKHAPGTPTVFPRNKQGKKLSKRCLKSVSSHVLCENSLINKYIPSTGCIKKLFPLCFLSISQLPIIRKIKIMIFFKSPFNGQFKNVQNFISRRKTHREIQQNILRIWNKNEQIWPLITSYF